MKHSFLLLILSLSPYTLHTSGFVLDESGPRSSSLSFRDSWANNHERGSSRRAAMAQRLSSISSGSRSSSGAIHHDPYSCIRRSVQTVRTRILHSNDWWACVSSSWMLHAISCGCLDELSWHPAGCLLLNEMSTSELGIALDARPKWKDVKVLLALLQLLRENVVHIHMDSPVVELLVKEVSVGVIE